MAGPSTIVTLTFRGVLLRRPAGAVILDPRGPGPPSERDDDRKIAIPIHGRNGATNSVRLRSPKGRSVMLLACSAASIAAPAMAIRRARPGAA